MELRISKTDYLRITINQTVLDAWAQFEEEGFVTKDSEEDSNIKLFAKLHKATRRQQKHRGLNKVKVNKIHLDICTYESLAFCKEYDLELRPGMLKFLEIAVKMEALPLHILQYRGEKISEYYQAEVEVRDNRNSALTDRLIAIYKKISLDKFGFFNPVFSIRDKVEFIRLARVIRKKGFNPEEYMEEAMEYWSWLNGTAKFKQLRSESMIKEMRGLTIAKPQVRIVKLRKGAERYDSD